MSSPPKTSSLIDNLYLPSISTSSSLPNISAFPVSHDRNLFTSPSSTSRTEAEFFQVDDLEFRTITTLLSILGTRDRITVDNFQVSREQRPGLKLLTSLSSLLVRNCESIAVMPKRTGWGTTLFVCSAAQNTTKEDFGDHESPLPAGSYEHSITRSQAFRDPVSPVELLNCPITDVDSDIFAFILQNWCQSFEHHVQSFATLLNKALANPDDEPAREALDLYSTFQSIPKICRRFRNSRWVVELLKVQPRFNVAQVPSLDDHVPSRDDQDVVQAILTTNPNGATMHSVLGTFLMNPPVDPQQWLPEFHRFFTWFIRIVIKEVKHLTKLRLSEDIPPGFSGKEIRNAYYNLAALQFLSWQSPFFAHYISAAFAPGILGPDDLAADVAAVRLSSALDEAAKLGSQPEKSEKEVQGEEVDGKMELDISTEFETSKEPGSVTTPSDDPHPCIRDLRLISSNIQNLDTLLHRTPRSHFRFEVVQYAPAGPTLMPWRDLIQELFPELELRERILQALADAPGKQFNSFRPGGNILTFQGQAHCEAVLGCLFSLTKRGEDNTWTGIPQSVLQAIGNCYSLLAPSKRCCPVCATIISLLSEEAVEAGGIGIHALSKHSITFPCALPVGLPRSIRHKLLHKYRHELRARLTALAESEKKKRSSSAKSAQSATLSLDGDSATKPTTNQKRLLRMYKSGWAELDETARRERWDAAGRGLAVGQLMSWWAEMSEEMKVGLAPPGQPVVVPEMANPELQAKVQA